MAGGPTNTSENVSTQGSDTGKYTRPFIVVTFLFFMWGFITVMNDVLIPHLKSVFDLNYTQAMFIQFATFIAYGLMSYPSGKIISAIGYKKSMILGLVVAGLGCVLFYPAAEYNIYAFFLGALFILFSGVTLLQVSANPYISVLGKPEKSSMRLNLAQGFNSLGTTIGPIFGTALILNEATEGTVAKASMVQGPYIGLAGAFIFLAAIIYISRLPLIGENYAEDKTASGPKNAIFKYPHLIMGVIGIFMYVGAEVSVGSFIVNFLEELSEAGVQVNRVIDLGIVSWTMTEGYYLSFYWGGLMVGRFIGAALMNKIKPGILLGIFSLVNVVLLSFVLLSEGSLALYGVIAVGLFNSIGFPTIFTLAIAGLGKLTSQGSSLLIMAIVGGAVVPPLQGLAADSFGVQPSFLVPIACFLYIAFYGFMGSKMKPKAEISEAAA